MNSISLPNVNITLNSAPTPSVGERRVLICGQIGLTGGQAPATIATTKVPVQNVHLLTVDAIGDYFGANSMLTATVVRFLDASGRQCPVDVMGISAGTGAATAAIVFSAGTAGNAGTLKINVISKTDYSVSVPVTVGMGFAALQTAIDTALDALVASTDCPFTVATADGTTTITATDLGTIGGRYSISMEDIPSGFTYTLTGFTNAVGAAAPTLTTMFANIADVRYTGILFPRDWEGEITQAKTLLEGRWNVSNAIMDGIAVVGYSDTAANLVTNKIDLLNSNVLVYVGNSTATSGSTTVKGNCITHYEDLIAAEILAYRDTRMTTGANIADIVSTTAPLDQVGGMSLASLPYFNTPLTYVPQPSDTAALFTDTQMAALEAAGYTVIGKNTRNTGMVQGFTVTTYKTNINGTSDTTFKYLNYVDTASVIREFIFNNLKADFAQVRLTNGPLRAGRAFTNAQLIRAAVKRYFELLSSSDIYGALVQGGSDAQAFIDKYLVVTTNLTTRSALISAQVPIVTQLGTITFPITITTTLA